MELTFAALKARQRRERDGYPSDIALRIHRALSWLDRSEQCGEDADGRFLFLWIAFNAAYAQEIADYEELTESSKFRQFFRKLVTLDQAGLLYAATWSEFSSSIRTLLDNQFVFAPFWKFHLGRISETEWKRDFSSSRRRANHALAKRNTATLLNIVFHRLYVLRNQLIHGGATWNSQVNREQVRDCAKILAKFVPLIIVILMNNPEEPWGEPSFPVVQTGG